MKNKKIKEGPMANALAGSLDKVFAVQKPYVGCQLSSLVKPIDPLVGLGGSEVVPDSVHAVFADQGAADKVANTLYLEFKQQRQKLAEKKLKVVEKTKKTMDLLEKKRKGYVDMMKENPGNVTEYRNKVAELATQIDELVNTMERVEKSRKLHEEDEEKTDKGAKKKFTYTDIKTKKESEIEAKDEKEAKYLVNKKGGDVTTVKVKEEAPAEEPKKDDKKEEKKDDLKESTITLVKDLTATNKDTSKGNIKISKGEKVKAGKRLEKDPKSMSITYKGQQYTVSAGPFINQYLHNKNNKK